MELSSKSGKIEEIEFDAIILGTYKDQFGDTVSKFNDKFDELFKLANFEGSEGEIVTLFNIPGIKAKRVIVVGLGKKYKADHETVRKAAGKAIKHARDMDVQKVGIEALNHDAQSTAEGIILGDYRFLELKTVDIEKYNFINEVVLVGDEKEQKSWQIGIHVANGECHARRLAELPSNIATPTFVCETASEIFAGEPVEILIHDEQWAKDKKMGAFLSVADGTDEPAKFLEMHYKAGGEAKPLVLVGKGITFDSGGISLKPSQGMGMMRGDMGGAAAVIGAFYAIVKNKLPINVIALTPLTENMPSGKATNPADVVTASNGKTIEVDNTDAEGRLILSDALVYAESFNPHTVIDMATLTGAMMVALGSGYVGTFTRSDELWKELEKAGNTTYEKFWRMPLDKVYRKQMDSTLADIKNVGGRAAGACTAAIFLSEFIELERWAHLDIAGVAWTNAESEYKPKGMTGIPSRAIYQFAANLCK